MSRIEAVSFDLWDTMVRHESDEPKRRALGLAPKDVERRRLIAESLARRRPVDPAALDLAWEVARAGFQTTWQQYAITWPLAQRLRVIAEGLGDRLDDDAVTELVERIGRMVVDVPPEPVEDIGAALESLAARYPLAVISDAIVVPGAWLRRLLAELGLARYFSTMAFSDEVGRAKPHRTMFETVARQMRVRPEGLVHVGDREHNDVSGARAVGARAVLFTGVHGEQHGSTQADVICVRHAELPRVVQELAQDSD